jgi:Raf kinase inhibitor-like YbhB/YbcL family protein
MAMLEKLPDAIGHALRNRRAGLENIAFNLIDLRAGTAAIEVSSLAFNDHAPIPEQYTADGAGTSPPLEWTGIPAGAASLLLIVEDADAPTPHPLVHAIAVDLAPQDGSLPEGALMGAEPDAVLKLGRNSYLQASWLPPDPPPGHGIHRYAFQIYALGPGPAFSGTPGREAVLEALQERAIASGCLIGTYERPDGSVKVGATEAAATRSDTALN